MGRPRKVLTIGTKLPGQLAKGALACSECWTVRSRRAFLSRPRQVKGGRWVALTLSICTSCRRRLRARKRLERSGSRASALSPVGVSSVAVVDAVHSQAKLGTSRRVFSLPIEKTLVAFPQFMPPGWAVTPYHHAWQVRSPSGTVTIAGW